jgi:hypothetical protein
MLERAFGRTILKVAITMSAVYDRRTFREEHMADDNGKNLQEGVLEKGLSGNRNANYKPSVPPNYNPPPPAQVPPPPKQEK